MPAGDDWPAGETWSGTKSDIGRRCDGQAARSCAAGRNRHKVQRFTFDSARSQKWRALDGRPKGFSAFKRSGPGRMSVRNSIQPQATEALLDLPLGPSRGRWRSTGRVPTSSPRAVSPLRSCSRIGRSSARDMCCRRGPVRRTITAASAHSRPGGNFTAGSRAARSFPSRWSPCRALWRSRPGPKAAAGLARRNQAVLLRQDLRLLALSEPDRRTDLNARHQYREADMGLVKGGGETGAPFSARPASSAMRA